MPRSTQQPDKIPRWFSPSNPWFVATTCGMVSYLDASALTGISTALLLYAPGLEISNQQIGQLSGLLTALFALGALIGGRAGDRHGRLRVFRWSLVLFLAGVALLAGAVQQAMLYAGVALTGAAVGANLPVSLALVSESVPDQLRGRMLTLGNFLWLMGIGVNSVLTSVFSKDGMAGGRAIFFHLIVTGVLLLLMSAVLSESKLWMEAQKKPLDGPPRRHIKFTLGAPVIQSAMALALFLTAWNVPANTQGLFGGLIFQNILGSTLEAYAHWSLVSMPIILLFMGLFVKVVDGPHRRVWFAGGAVAYVLAYLIPFAVGPSLNSVLLGGLFMLFGLIFAGEGVFKIISQELIPTEVRATVQGFGIALGRLVAAAFAVGAPALMVGDGRGLYFVLSVCAMVSGAALCLWIPRRPTLGLGQQG